MFCLSYILILHGTAHKGKASEEWISPSLTFFQGSDGLQVLPDLGCSWVPSNGGFSYLIQSWSLCVVRGLVQYKLAHYYRKQLFYRLLTTSTCFSQSFLIACYLCFMETVSFLTFLRILMGVFFVCLFFKFPSPWIVCFLHFHASLCSLFWLLIFVLKGFSWWPSVFW